VSFADLAPWAALAALGAYHGLNPGMGWLFAVARGLQERKRGEVLLAVWPIAAGHEASIMAVLLATVALEAVVAAHWIRLAAAAVLLLFAAALLLRRRIHPKGFGMRVGYAGLAGWSFLMSSAHGAGLMILPVFLGMTLAVREPALPTTVGQALLAGAVHTGAMLLVMTAIAVVVYDRLGLRLLRKAWVNLDLVWAAALFLAAIFVTFTA
jgi:hypothetical protein